MWKLRGGEEKGDGFQGGLIVIILILAAFGAGFGCGFHKLYKGEKERAAAKGVSGPRAPLSFFPSLFHGL